MDTNQRRFLKDVGIFTFSAFGGPQAHIAMMLKEFVARKKYVTEEELIEYIALSQMLPGPSSTQTLVAIAYRVGGIRIALLSFLIWILPSALFMSFFAIFFSMFNFNQQTEKALSMLRPIAVGFVAYSAYLLTAKVLSSRISYVLAGFSAIVTLWFQNAYVFPLVLLVGIISTSIFLKLENEEHIDQVKFNWKKLIPLIGILIFFAVLGAFINRTSFSVCRFVCSRIFIGME